MKVKTFYMEKQEKNFKRNLDYEELLRDFVSNVTNEIFTKMEKSMKKSPFKENPLTTETFNHCRA